MSKPIRKNREQLLWKLISNVRSNVDINKIKKMAVRGLSDVFDPDRCTIVEYDKNQHTRTIEKNSEYLASKDEKSMVGINLDDKYDFWNMTNALTDMYLRQKQNVIYIPDAAQYIKQSNLLGSKIEKYCTYSNFTTCVGVSIFEDNKIKMFFTVKFKRKKQLSSEDIEFIKIYAEQVYIAIKQNRAIIQFKEASVKEKMLRKIVNIIRGTLDIKKITRTFVFNIGKRLGVSRSFFSKYDPLTNTFLTPEESAEYLTYPDMLSYRDCGRDFSIGYKFFSETLILTRKMIIMNDREEFIKNNNIEGTNDAINLRRYNIGSAIVVPIVYRENILGLYVFDYEKPNSFTQEEIDFVVAVSEQTSVAIYQAELFEKNKRRSKREKIIREIVTMIRKTLDTEKIIKTYVFKMGKFLKARRIFFSKYDAATDSCLTPDENAEYISSPDVVRYKTLGRRLDDEFPVFCEKLKKTKENFSIPNMEEFFKELKIGNNINIDNFRKYGFNSGIAFPIFAGEKFLGFYAFEYENETSLLQEDIDFLTIVAQQTSIAMNQAILFEQNKRRSEREKILSEIVNIIRKSLDIDKIIHTYVFDMGQYLGADRVFFSRYNAEENIFMFPDEKTEYLSSADVPSYKGLEGTFEDFFSYVLQYLKTSKEHLAIKDVAAFIKENNLEGTLGAETAKKFQAGSTIIIPVIYGDKLMGGYAVDYKEPYSFTEEDVDFIVSVSEQSAIALYQAELFFKVRRQAKNEAILRKIITRAATTLNMDDIKKMARDIGRLSKADRCYFVEVDIEKKEGKSVSAQEEYLSSPDIKTIVGYDFLVEDIGKFVDFYLTAVDIGVFDYEKMREENNPLYVGILKYADLFHLKSGIGVPFFYRGKLFSLLAIEYVKEKTLPSSSELEFLRFIGKQVGIAFNQIKLYREAKETAEREVLLRSISSKMSSTLDIKEITKYITELVGTTFGLERCIIIEYDNNANVFKPVDEYAEYRSSNQVKSTIGYDYSARNMGLFRRMSGTVYVDSFMEGVFDQDAVAMKNYLKEFDIEKGFQVSLFYGDKLIGILSGHSGDKNKVFSNQDKELIKILAKQAGIAIYQSQLYLQEKETAEREKLLRDIITTTRSTFNIREIKKTIVNEILKTVNADLVAIFEYYNDIEKFGIIDNYSEALSSFDRTSFKGVDVNIPPYEYFADVYRSKNEIIYSDLDEFLKTTNLAGSAEAALMYKMSAKSLISIPILYRNETLGALLIIFEKKHQFKMEKVDFIKSLSEQIGIALYQSRLFEKEKKGRIKEKLLNKIVSTIRKNLDLNQMKHTIATEIGKYLKADRVVIQQINPIKKEYYIIDEYSEYRAAEDITSYVGINLERPELSFFKELFGTEKEMLAPDFLEYLENLTIIDEKTKQWIKNMGIKSDYAFPIKYQDTHLASLYITYDKEQVTLSQEELSDIRFLAVQIGLALNQAITYQDLQAKIDQESLLRKVTEAIRGSLDIQDIKQKIVDELGKTLGADRCYLRSFDTEADMFLAPEVEYLASEDISSLKNVVPDQEGLRYFFEQVKTQDGIYPVEVTEDFIIEHQAKNKALDRYFKQANIKSDFAMPVWSKKGELTFLVLHYIHKSFLLTEEVRQLLIMLSKQISLALEQSDLYSELKLQTERERASRKVVDIIRSSLDLNQILTSVAQELLVLFDVQRIFTGKIDFTLRENFVEVAANDHYHTFTTSDYFTFNLVAQYWQDYLKTYKTFKMIDNIENSDMPPNIKQIYSNMQVKSVLAVPIKSQDEIWGGIFLSAMDKEKKWTNNEIGFLEGIVTQLDTAIRQAELYAFQKKTAKKESILRSIISEIKLTRNLNQAYGKLLQQLAEAFNLNRVLFLESSSIVPEELHTKYEYVIDRADLSVNNLIFPPICMEKFLNLIKHLKLLTINDVSLCHPKNTLDFFEKYKIRAMMAVPLVKYNRETKVLGFIVLCSEDKRTWTDEEIDLINAISDSVVSVIWEISKFIEIEDLRNSFVLTLAHDFQVPLIGEKLAIEYLLESSSESEGKNKELLKEILENNNNIITLLNKSVDIYNYEAGKKILTLDVYEISEILQNAVYVIQNSLKKSVNIKLTEFENPLFLKVDKSELMKVLFTLMENAIEHTIVGEDVDINYYLQNKRIIISVHNKGAAIPLETQEIIFKRYEMALAIERKIGAGTGLFLAKKIIEAHKGTIWFETNNKTGTTFYISLPQVELKHV